MGITDSIRNTKTRAQRLADQQIERDRAIQRQQLPERPDWVKGDGPQISLSAAYAGSIRPEDVPRDGVTYRTLTGREREPELTDAQRAGVDAEATIQARRDLRRAVEGI